jgi:hypothetical protein
MRLHSIFLFITLAHVGLSSRLRGPLDDSVALPQESRQLQDYYYSTADPSILGKANHMAAIGNPLKGLLTSPQWTGGNTRTDVPSSLEFHYIGLDSVMKGNNQFDWTNLDKTLSEAASRNNHVIWRIFCHYPGEPLRLPQYLLNSVKLVPIKDGSVSPQYDDPILLEAFRQFIAAFGKRYDGHKSIGFIQLGLLGYWGEWHTYPDEGLLSEATMNKVVNWYAAAFKTTQLQCRASLPSAIAAGMGLHDDSFAYSTLGKIDWFFWPKVESAKQTSFWKKGAMGGETRPELQASVFDPSYKPGSDEYKQDFNKCVDVTHATYMFHHWIFVGDNIPSATLNNARNAHARMGYNFQVTKVGAESVSDGLVTVDITVTQTGVAPFYYPLSLALECPSTTATLPGVDSLMEAGSSKVFSFTDIPADSACLESIEIKLQSNFAPAGRPVKFAQGNDGTVSLKIPLPGSDGSATSQEQAKPNRPFSMFFWLFSKLRNLIP